MKIFFIAIVAGAVVSVNVYAAEREISLADAPKAAQKGIRDVVGKGKITKIVKEKEHDGSVIYEVAYTIGSTKFEAEVSPEGKLVVVDEQISISQAPKPVRKVIEEKTAGGRIIKIEKATQGKEVFYEAEFMKGGKEREVKVAPNGTVLETK